MKKNSKRLAEYNYYRRLIGRLLILIGTCLIGTVITVNVVDYVRSRKAVSDFQTHKENPQDAFMTDNQEPEEDETKLEAIQNDEIEMALGILRIPKIDLEEAIKEGSTSGVISSALGHMEDTAMPGEIGNCAIAGHRNYVFGRFFNRLDEIGIGDTIEIETLDGVYVYTVTDSFVVTPDEVSVLSQDTNTQDITLITCTPLFIGSHRLIIKGTMTAVSG